MSEIKKIAVITGSRAEFGLFRPVLDRIMTDPELEMKLYVTGMHVEARFGRTVNEIKDAGYEIAKMVDIFLQDDTARGIARSTALSMMGFADAFSADRPDMLLVLGDRFEIFGAVSAACVLGIPVGHIHGGELTEGVMDDPFRHAITKMSQLHFAAAETYRRRIIQLGEQPARVFNTGSPSVDAAMKVEIIDKAQLEKELGMKFADKNLLITYHSVILDTLTPKQQFEELLKAVDKTDAYLIFTYANADTGGAVINSMIDDYVSGNQNRAYATRSFGHRRYLSVMNVCDGLVGNSSSAIVEASVMKKGAVNIGMRQQGRVRGVNIIDCETSAESISKAIDFMYTDSFRDSIKDMSSPYGDGDAAEKIVSIIKDTQLKDLCIKKFYDLEFL
jgi:GDP/UDP-N,N'-diacetylbacillosamine 2-epimerase (hydrolysing)